MKEVMLVTALEAKMHGYMELADVDAGYCPNDGRLLDGQLWRSLRREESERHICAPTQTQLHKWLREKHRLNVNVKHKPFNQKYGYDITGSYQPENKGVFKVYDFKGFDTYEEALENGLYDALKLLPYESNSSSKQP